MRVPAGSLFGGRGAHPPEGALFWSLTPPAGDLSASGSGAAPYGQAGHTEVVDVGLGGRRNLGGLEAVARASYAPGGRGAGWT